MNLVLRPHNAIQPSYVLQRHKVRKEARGFDAHASKVKIVKVALAF